VIARKLRVFSILLVRLQGAHAAEIAAAGAFASSLNVHNFVTDGAIWSRYFVLQFAIGSSGWWSSILPDGTMVIKQACSQK